MAEETTWAKKLDIPRDVEIRPAPEGRKNLHAGQHMLFPNGRVVDTLIRGIPEGQTLTTKEVRGALAHMYGADMTCPVTTGLCLRAVAEAAHESFAAGTPIEEVTPVWRVLDGKAPTLKKESFDPAFMLEQRVRESQVVSRSLAKQHV